MTFRMAFLKLGSPHKCVLRLVVSLSFAPALVALPSGLKSHRLYCITLVLCCQIPHRPFRSPSPGSMPLRLILQPFQEIL